ncbi:hypothetical protein NBRC116597_23670 [Phaeobacter sp. NW0010-22]
MFLLPHCSNTGPAIRGYRAIRVHSNSNCPVILDPGLLVRTELSADHILAHIVAANTERTLQRKAVFFMDHLPTMR